MQWISHRWASDWEMMVSGCRVVWDYRRSLDSILPSIHGRCCPLLSFSFGRTEDSESTWSRILIIIHTVYLPPHLQFSLHALLHRLVLVIIPPFKDLIIIKSVSLWTFKTFLPNLPISYSPEKKKKSWDLMRHSRSDSSEGNCNWTVGSKFIN